MNVPCRSGRFAPLRLLLALLALALAPGRARAQTCPSISLTITRTTAAGDPTGANQDNLPTQIVAHHDPDPNAFPAGDLGLPAYQDQVTTFGYDEGLTPPLGNLTSITRRDDSGQLWKSTLQYDTPAGVYGPPGHLTNEVGAPERLHL